MQTETIIINCSTKEQSTLALVSAVRRSPAPVTLVDCESTDGSAAFFATLRARLPFRLEERPLAPHGITLDRLFRASRADAVLLLDSDAELLRDDLVPKMIDALAGPAYGSGFLHHGEWMGAAQGEPERMGYYAPRMWIPCVLLAVRPVQAALAAGVSFADRRDANELPQFPRLARALQLRFRVPALKRLRLDALARWRSERFGERPHFVYHDTGALMHAALVAAGHTLADLGGDLWLTGVRHYHGVTRRRLAPGTANAADPDATRQDAVARIESVYGLAVPELAAGLGRPS
jgi:glycosyltransferase involved in cell wall biosynthesis